MFGRLWKLLEKLTPASAPLLPRPPRPLTEGKTRSNIKRQPPTAKRPKRGPPEPRPKHTVCVPNYAIKCEWIEVYVPDPKGFYDGCNLEHHDNVSFWVDTNGNLVVWKGLCGGNTVTYHNYRKYITNGIRHWG